MPVPPPKPSAQSRSKPGMRSLSAARSCSVARTAPALLSGTAEPSKIANEARKPHGARKQRMQPHLQPTAPSPQAVGSDDSADDSGAGSEDECDATHPGKKESDAASQGSQREARKDAGMTKQMLEEALRAGAVIRKASEGLENATNSKGASRMTNKAMDRARSIADRRQRQELHNARRRVVYVADRSGDGSSLGMVGRSVSVQPSLAHLSREELVARVVAPQMTFGMGAMGAMNAVGMGGINSVGGQRHVSGAPGAEEGKVSNPAARQLSLSF